jgi:hypothetical protein
MATASKLRKVPAPARKPAAKKTVAAKAVPKRPQPPAAAPAPVRAPAPQAAAAKDAKADKPKKHKLVRDSFTIPKAEYTVLQDLKQRAGMTGTAVKKSEILRAGIKALAAMNDAAFAAALHCVPAIKTGRPAKE